MGAGCVVLKKNNKKVKIWDTKEFKLMVLTEGIGVA